MLSNISWISYGRVEGLKDFPTEGKELDIYSVERQRRCSYRLGSHHFLKRNSYCSAKKQAGLFLERKEPVIPRQQNGKEDIVLDWTTNILISTILLKSYSRIKGPTSSLISQHISSMKLLFHIKTLWTTQT